MTKSCAMAIVMASGVLLAPQWACAAGLQGITVHSALGQPLRAEIAVSATKEELVGMTTYLASRAAFAQAGLRYSATLRQLRFELQPGAGGALIKVTSVGPINDPFVQFLLELSWPAGRVSREYTFLIDPLRDKPTTPPAVVAPVAPSVKEASAPTGSEPPAEAAKAAPTAGGHVVKPGETLYRVARDNLYPGVTQEQMQVAIYLRNPGAFDGAITRLRAGAVLVIPALEEVRAVPASPRRSVRAGSGAPVESRPAPSTRRGDGDDAKKKPGVTRKALEEREKTLRDNRIRAEQLEKNRADLQRQLEEKNQNIAEMQKRLEAQKSATAAPPAIETLPATPAPPVVTPDALPVPGVAAPDAPP
ncbi:MAG: hypothetical protein LBD68_07700, partial [Zoogloeaceae bacterium]|nr:hypothetical protein [Zoogloeaceae bacterium]